MPIINKIPPIFASSLQAPEKQRQGKREAGNSVNGGNKNWNIPFLASSSSSPFHSFRKRLAPVRLPSPPITHRLVMPKRTKLQAAFRRPSRLRKAWQRALPMIVPPWRGHKSCSLTGSQRDWHRNESTIYVECSICFPHFHLCNQSTVKVRVPHWESMKKCASLVPMKDKWGDRANVYRVTAASQLV